VAGAVVEVRSRKRRAAKLKAAKRRDEHRRGFITWRLGGSRLSPSLARISTTMH
jgi:hypothetical protein